MSELFRQVIDTNDQIDFLCITVERLLKAQATTMTGPQVTSASTVLDTASPIKTMAATTGTTYRPSGYLPLDPPTIPRKQFPNMPASTPLLDHHNLSTLGGCDGFEFSATPFLGFCRHAGPW